MREGGFALLFQILFPLTAFCFVPKLFLFEEPESAFEVETEHRSRDAHARSVTHSCVSKSLSDGNETGTRPARSVAVPSHALLLAFRNDKLCLFLFFLKQATL